MKNSNWKPSKEDYERSCRSKNCYATKDKARYWAAVSAKLTGHQSINIYRCRYGRHYHIGHNNKFEKLSPKTFLASQRQYRAPGPPGARGARPGFLRAVEPGPSDAYIRGLLAR